MSSQQSAVSSVCKVGKSDLDLQLSLLFYQAYAHGQALKSSHFQPPLLLISIDCISRVVVRIPELMSVKLLVKYFKCAFYSFIRLILIQHQPCSHCCFKVKFSGCQLVAIPQRGIWQCLETFLIVTIKERGLLLASCWQNPRILVNIPQVHRAAPTTKNNLSQNVGTAKVKRP